MNAWSTKFAALSASPLLDSNAKQTPMDTNNQEQGSPNMTNSNSGAAATSTIEDHSHDTLTHKALLKNEFLNHSIVDIRVNFNYKSDQSDF